MQTLLYNVQKYGFFPPLFIKIVFIGWISVAQAMSASVVV